MNAEMPDELMNREPAGLPDAPNDAPRPDTPSPAAAPVEPIRPTLAQLALGGALLISENVGARLEVPYTTEEVAARTRESVLRPAAEWENATTPIDQARYVAIGFTHDARSRAGQSGRGFYKATDELGRAIDEFTRPIRRSRLLRPIRNRFLRYQEQGERHVTRWAAIGRQEEIRSRALAEASLGGFVQRSVNDLTESQQVQVLVQQVVSSQGTSIIEELLEEIRERMVTLDILVERRLRRILRRPPREELPPPVFRKTYIAGRPTLSPILRIESTMAGQYAGMISRLMGFVIDIIIILIVLSLTTTFITAFINLFDLVRFFNQFPNLENFAGIVAGVAGLLTVVGYGVLSWSLSGQTIGDLIFGVRVVRTDGRRVSFGRAVLRIVGAYISGLALFLGFLWGFWDKRNQGWHDKIAGTVVIYDWPAVPDELFLRDELAVTPVLPRQKREN